MKLKIPPVLVFLIFTGLMYLLERYLPVGEFDFFGRIWLIRLLVAGAILISIMAIFQFIKARTTVDPVKPASAKALVTNGVYQYSRNPMYLAMLMLLLAWGLWLGNAFNTLLAASFVAYMNRFQISPEEEALKQLFDKEYLQYCLRVRRWF